MTRQAGADLPPAARAKAVGFHACLADPDGAIQSSHPCAPRREPHAINADERLPSCPHVA